MFQMTIKLGSDSKECTFTFPSEPVALTATDLEDLIVKLAAIRERMQPEVNLEPPIGSVLETLENPRYWTNYHEMTEGTLLTYRHPGMGWLALHFPPAEREKLIGLFEAQRQERLKPKTHN